MNPFVFIVGNPRSGTTLLRHILDSHSQIAFLLETPWFMNWLEKRIGVDAEGFVTPELSALLLPNRRLFRDIDLGIGAPELAEIIGHGKLPWGKFISILCDRYGQARGKPLVGNKTPSFVRRIQAMHRLWPGAKFIHIIRDGRDVLLSARDKWKDKTTAPQFRTWHEDEVTTLALWWEWNVRLGREAGSLLDSNQYCEIRYEALVTEPENECVRLCNFLNVPFEQGMLRHEDNFRIRHVRDGSIVNARVALPITPGLRNWRSVLLADELERFEVSAGNLLDELGYARGTERLWAESIDRAAGIRQLFQARPLPNHW